MRSKLPVGLLLLLGLVYVGFGDQFLPPEIGRYSFQARNALDTGLVGLFPSWRPKTAPNKRTTDAIESIEGSSNKSK